MSKSITSLKKTQLHTAFLSIGIAAVSQLAVVPATTAAVLEEVVVSASRKEESIQDAPAVIAVIGAKEIQKQRIGDLTDITSAVPGLSLDGSHKDQNRLGMRGAFSSADTPSAGQAVGLYIDGVYFGRSASMGPVLFDMQQIEVLKGPQGTLYGPNVVGGLINITTKNPSLEAIEGAVQATAGNFGSRELAGRISVPIIEDELGVSVSVMKADSDGWVENLVTGNMLDQTDTLSVRAKMLWTPNDRTKVEAFLDSWGDDSYGEVRHIYTRFGTASRFDVQRSIDETYINDDARYDRDVLTGGLTVSYDLSDSVTLKSITSYNDTDSLGEDLPFLTGLIEGINATRDSQIETFTQEVLVFGETDRLEWQVGAFYYDDSSSTLELFESTQVPGTPIVEFGYPEYFETYYLMDTETTSMSVFGQVTYALTEWMNLTAGIRYLDEEKDSLTQTYGDVFPGNYAAEEAYTVDQSGAWTVSTPKFGVDMHWDDVGAFDSLMAYATVTKGFKSGDFVKGTTFTTSIGTTEPEEVWNYEAGIKTTFMDGLANANLTVFQADYQDLQSQVQGDDAFVYLVTNDAEARGLEAELNLAPIDGLSIALTYAYLDTEITGDELVDGESVKGNILPRSPENSYGLTVGYEWTVGEFGLELFASYTKQDEAYISILNELPDDILALTEQERLNLDFTVRYDALSLSVWGKNLTDDSNLYEGQDLTDLWGLTNDEFFGETASLWNVRFAQPRTFGATVRYEF